MGFWADIAKARTEDESAFTVLTMGGTLTLFGFVVSMLVTNGHTWAGVLWAFALYSAGLFAGFLFSVARVVQGPTIADSNDSSSVRYEPNGAIEQIADWLTKIIVGLTLIELQKIPQAINQLASHIADAVAPGGKPSEVASAAAVGIAMIVFFPIMGFLGAYLSTRLFLNAEIKRREDAFRKAEKAVAILHEPDSEFSTNTPEVVGTQEALWSRSSQIGWPIEAGTPSGVVARALHAILSAAGVSASPSGDPRKMLALVRERVTMRGRQAEALNMITQALDGLKESTPGAYELMQRVQETLLDLARRKGNERVYDTIASAAISQGREGDRQAKRGVPQVRIDLLVDNKWAFVVGTAVADSDLDLYAARFLQYAAALKADAQPVIALNDPYALIETTSNDYPAVLFRVNELILNAPARRAVPWLTKS